MRIVNRDSIMALKQERRAKIEELKYHFDGDLVHLGRISRGCRTCFSRNTMSQYPIYTGVECNLNCGYCYYEKTRTDVTWNSEERIRGNLTELYNMILDPLCDIREVTYNSFGETLKYPTIIEEGARLVKQAEKNLGRRIYSHLYTNGVLANEEMLKLLKKCDVTELRFHVSASNFSKRVFKNMRIAKEMDFVVSVEEPSLPENKQKILDHLKEFEDIGIIHLNLIECQVTNDNRSYLEKKYPTGRIYRDRLWHLYDEGMVYDIMEEVIKNKYNYSVIDCNSRVECCRAGEAVNGVVKEVDFDEEDDAFAEFDVYDI
jgi:pyruvate formate-lyase activating enzyme-like uncharacterized protein